MPESQMEVVDVVVAKYQIGGWIAEGLLRPEGDAGLAVNWGFVDKMKAVDWDFGRAETEA